MAPTHIADPEVVAQQRAERELAPDGTGDDKGTEDKTSLISDIDPDEPEQQEPDESKDSEGDGEGEGEKEDATEDDETPADEGADYSGWTEEFLADGELSDETRKTVIDTLFDAKVPQEVREEMIRTYEAGLTSIRADTTRAVFDLVGGETEYQTMLAWGNENLSPEEVEVFDKATLGADAGVRAAAVKGLHAQMQQALGKEPDFEPNLAHDGGRAGGEPIIASRQELAKIQATDEYKKDPAVRAKVSRQLRQSLATGKYISD